MSDIVVGHLLTTTWLSALCEFVRNLVSAEDFAQDLQHGASINGDRAVYRLVIVKVPHERLNVAVEDQANQFSIAVDCR